MKTKALLIFLIMTFISACNFEKREFEKVLKADYLEVSKDDSVDGYVYFLKKYATRDNIENSKYWLKKCKERLSESKRYYITCTHKYDEYGNLALTCIYNIKGEFQISVGYFYHNYGYNSIKVRSFYKETDPEDFNNLYVSPPEEYYTNKYLCFDIDGNLIKNANWEGTVLADPFFAVQTTMSISDLNDQGLEEAPTLSEIYPCLNCADSLDVPECLFVF